MIDFFLPEFTNVPRTNWQFIIAMLQIESSRGTQLPGRIHRPWVFGEDLKSFLIVKPRIAVIQTQSNIQWYHVCRPVKLTEAIEENLIDPTDPWFELDWKFGHFNSLPDPNSYRMREWKCLPCYYRLTNPEILMVKAAILKMKT